MLGVLRSVCAHLFACTVSRQLPAVRVAIHLSLASLRSVHQKVPALYIKSISHVLKDDARIIKPVPASHDPRSNVCDVLCSCYVLLKKSVDPACKINRH